ncbi:deoxyuridine 5'-triphosphate nucleotidohydrolase [Tanacetum coccineum]
MANSTNAKIQKLNDDQIPPPIFKVKKLSENAVLPTRGSSLAAGYDLSSAVEAKVPARGKALVATDLSNLRDLVWHGSIQLMSGQALLMLTIEVQLW